jgi:hypothetical protein
MNDEHARSSTPGDTPGPGGPGDDPALWGPRLRRLIGEQCDLCRRVEALGERQARCVLEDDTDGLLRLLAERQSLLDRLGVLSEQTAPYRSGWESWAPRLPAAEREAMRRLIAEMAATVERIAARDDADRGLLERRRARLAEGLSSLQRGRGALAAYAGDAQHGPTYQDQEG